MMEQFNEFINNITSLQIILSKILTCFRTADILPLYKLLDSGISSPDTIYNIAPCCKT